MEEKSRERLFQNAWEQTSNFYYNAINIQLVIIQKTKNRESSWEKDKQNEQFVFSLTQLCKNLTQHWHGRCANVIYLALVIFKHPLTGKKKKVFSSSLLIETLQKWSICRPAPRKGRLKDLFEFEFLSSYVNRTGCNIFPKQSWFDWQAQHCGLHRPERFLTLLVMFDSYSFISALCTWLYFVSVYEPESVLVP